MIIKLKRDWFGPGAAMYREGTREYHGAKELLPSDAVIISDDESLSIPSGAPIPQPGHGAKPVEEQILDLIPGAGLTHMIGQNTSEAPALTDEEKAKKDAEATSVTEAAAKEAGKDAEKAAAEEAAAIKTGISNAEKAAKKVVDKNDPLKDL